MAVTDRVHHCNDVARGEGEDKPVLNMQDERLWQTGNDAPQDVAMLRGQRQESNSTVLDQRERRERERREAAKSDLMLLVIALNQQIAELDALIADLEQRIRALKDRNEWLREENLQSEARFEAELGPDWAEKIKGLQPGHPLYEEAQEYKLRNEEIAGNSQQITLLEYEHSKATHDRSNLSQQRESALGQGELINNGDINAANQAVNNAAQQYSRIQGTKNDQSLLLGEQEDAIERDSTYAQNAYIAMSVEDEQLRDALRGQRINNRSEVDALAAFDSFEAPGGSLPAFLETSPPAFLEEKSELNQEFTQAALGKSTDEKPEMELSEASPAHLAQAPPSTPGIKLGG